MITEYIYRGDRFTDQAYQGAECRAVKRPDGKCIRSKKGTMLVSFEGVKVIVIARLLRKIKNI